MVHRRGRGEVRHWVTEEERLKCTYLKDASHLMNSTSHRISDLDTIRREIGKYKGHDYGPIGGGVFSLELLDCFHF